MLRLLLLGVGRWGKNILRTLEAIPEVEVVVCLSAQEGLAAEGIDGVIIATPGSTHGELALPFIERGLPIFIEKPMTTSSREAVVLQRAAQQSGAPVFVGHIHLYNPAFLEVKRLLSEVGRIQLIQFEGMAPGPVREDMSVWWDWGPHGVSMAIDLLGEQAIEAQAWGAHLLPTDTKLEDIVEARVLFAGGAQVVCNVSWMWPRKRMCLTVVGERGALIFDDRAEEKVVQLQGEERVVHSFDASLFPLELELKAFVEMVMTGKAVRTNIDQGVAVVQVLEAVEESMRQDGGVVRIE